tara:strand:- start:1201 stop:1998 length:798 start_codon:yes stop_codon:yes gene_type:complete
VSGYPNVVTANLSAHDIEDYNRDGYLIVKGPVVEPATVDAICRFAEDAYATSPLTESGETPQLINCPHWGNPIVFDWLFDAAVLDIIESLIGPNIGLFASHFLRKPSGSGKRVPWHEDSSYWRSMIEAPMRIVSINLALEPWTTANGCLRVIPGTHANGFSDYKEVSNPEEQVFPAEILAEQMDESAAVDLVLDRGDISIHEAQIVHGSNANTSDTGRSAFAMRYFPTSVKIKDNPDFSIYLARGVDLGGNHFADPDPGRHGERR